MEEAHLESSGGSHFAYFCSVSFQNWKMYIISGNASETWILFDPQVGLQLAENNLYVSISIKNTPLNIRLWSVLWIKKHVLKLQQRILSLRTRSGIPPAQAFRLHPAPTDPCWDPWDLLFTPFSPLPSQRSSDGSSRREPRALKWRSSQDHLSQTNKTSLWRQNRSMSM